jgi:hypothetical protein
MSLYNYNVATPNSTVPYPTLPYRFPLQFLSLSRSLTLRGVPYFLPKIHRFPAKKVKSANRTVFKIKTFLAL